MYEIQVAPSRRPTSGETQLRNQQQNPLVASDTAHNVLASVVDLMELSVGLLPCEPVNLFEAGRLTPCERTSRVIDEQWKETSIVAQLREAPQVGLKVIKRDNWPILFPFKYGEVAVRIVPIMRWPRVTPA
jgi:hypothetical protein